MQQGWFVKVKSKMKIVGNVYYVILYISLLFFSLFFITLNNGDHNRG